MPIWQKKISENIFFPPHIAGDIFVYHSERKNVDELFYEPKEGGSSWITRHNMIKSTAIVTLN